MPAPEAISLCWARNSVPKNESPAILEGPSFPFIQQLDKRAIRLLRYSRGSSSGSVTLTGPPKLDGFQLEEIASFCPSAILTEFANSIGVRFPIELWGRCSL